MKVTKKSTPVKKEKDLFVCVCKSGTFLKSGKNVLKLHLFQQKNLSFQQMFSDKIYYIQYITNII